MNLNQMRDQAFDNASRKGFWTRFEFIPEKLALLHTEISEAMDVYRKPGPFNLRRFGEELADLVIRTGDLAGRLNIDLEKAVQAKMKKNANRPHMHGKRC